MIPESAIHHDDKIQVEEVEPPRLFSAAVHPTPNHSNDTFTASSVPDVDLLPSSRTVTVDSANHVGTDSPRRLGRSRTDTMVFSEAFSVAEELSRTGDDGNLLDTSPVTEAQSLVSDHSWPDLRARTEDLDDEDIGDARSEITLTAPLSPPVEALSLISLEDTADVATDTPSEPLQLHPDTPVIETSAEQPVQAVDVDEDSAPATGVVESTPEVDATSSEVLTESARTLPEPELSMVESADENDGSSPLSSEEGPKEAEPGAETDSPPPPFRSLELNEPPSSEPIPPENESDITDEVGGHDGDEVKESGEEAAVASE